VALKELKDELKNNNFNNVYLFYGNENYLKTYYLNLLKNTVIKEQDDFNCIEFNFANADVGDIYDAVLSYPITSDRKVVIVKDMELEKSDKNEIEALINIINDVADFCVLIFYQLNSDYPHLNETTKPFIKELEKKANTVNFEKQKKTDLVSWALRRFASEKKEISNEDVLYLLDITDNTMQNLINEITKICNYCSVDRVTRKMIDDIVVKTVDAKVYEMTDFIINRNPQKAYEVLDDLINLKYDVNFIAGSVFSLIRNLIVIKSADDNNILLKTVEKDTKIKEYTAKKLLQTSKRISDKKLLKCMEICQQSDALMKRADEDKGIIIMQRLIAQLSMVLSL